MPSPIAHAVTGYCVGKFFAEVALVKELSHNLRRRLIGTSIFASIAADFDFLPQLFSDYSFHRGISHSIGAAVLCSLLLVAFSFMRTAGKISLVVFLLTVSSFSLHLLMDLVTAGGRGIPIFWPVSSSLIQLPFAFFPQVHHSEGLWYSGHIPVLIFEAVFSAILIFSTLQLIRFWHRTRFNNEF
jgi:membrane-bound metal-dependent hydrolase YbcI (DUF457 family)